MKILAMSDTHRMHWRMGKLPDADLLIHTGDFSMIGTKEEALDFLEWFTTLPHRHKVFICGNHDEALLFGNVKGLLSNCHYLNYSSVKIEGLKVYGIPFYVERYDNKEAMTELESIWERDIDILISHQPPYGILDYSEQYGNYGSRRLLSKIKELRPRYHIFGHIHEGYGMREKDGTTFINCALMGENLERLVKRSFILEIC